MTAQESYLSAVSRAMDCSSSTKHRLLDGLRQELSDTDADFEALCAQYGAPEDTARELMECVDPDELKKRKRNKKIAVGSVFTVLLIVCGILFTYYLHAKEVINGDFYIVIEETTYEEDEIPDDLFSEPDGKGID